MRALGARRSALVALVAVAAVAAVPALASQEPSTLGLATLEARVNEHPAVRAAAARVDEARGRARQAGTLTNPTVGLVTNELRPRENPSGHFGGFIEQMLPLGGKRAAARAEGEAGVDQRMAELELVRLGVLVDIRRAYYGVLMAEERVRVLTRQRELGAESVTVAGQLLNIGLVDRSDVLQAEAEAARLTARHAGAVAMLDGAWRRLAAAAGDASLGPRPLAEPGALPDLDRSTVRAQLQSASPALRIARAEVARERLAVAVAQTISRPDLFLRGEVGWNREHTVAAPTRPIGFEFGVEIGISLPVVNRNAGGIDASLAALRAAEAEEAALVLALDAHLADAFVAYDSSRLLAEAYRSTVLPRAEQAHDLYLARYREMAAAYPDVLTSAQTLATMREEYLDAMEAAWDAAVRLQGLLVAGGGM